MVLAYRLETETGVGPFYTTKYRNRKLTSVHSNHYTSTICDKKITSDHIFGWNSKEKILSFIPSKTKLNRFIKNGFIINLYKPIEFILFDDGQVAFIRSDVIKQYDIELFFKDNLQ